MNGFHCSPLLVPPELRAHEQQQQQHPSHRILVVFFAFLVATFFMIALVGCKKS
jgi:hypothetical protein